MGEHEITTDELDDELDDDEAMAAMFDPDLTPLFTLDGRMVAATLESDGGILHDAGDAAAFWDWLENSDEDLDALISVAKQLISGQYEAWNALGRPR